MEKYYYARGRRKSASARLKLHPGKGLLTINKNTTDVDEELTEIFSLVGQQNKWDVESYVHGGGIAGQKDAIKLAIARALVEFDNNLKTTLRKAGFLTRDPREKERKKPGLKRARRAPQWSKR